MTQDDLFGQVPISLGHNDLTRCARNLRENTALVQRLAQCRKVPRYYCRKCGYPNGPDWLDDGETCPKCLLVQ